MPKEKIVGDGLQSFLFIDQRKCLDERWQRKIRDDAVYILIARIRQLDAENERIIEHLPLKIQDEETKCLR